MCNAGLVFIPRCPSGCEVVVELRCAVCGAGEVQIYTLYKLLVTATTDRSVNVRFPHTRVCQPPAEARCYGTHAARFGRECVRCEQGRYDAGSQRADHNTTGHEGAVRAVPTANYHSGD